MSRTVIAHVFSAVNGVVESPNLFQFGAEEGELMGRTIAPVTDVVISRVLRQEWSEYWPTATDPFAQFVNPVRKHVVTSTLSGDLPWNSRIVDGDPVAHLGALREQDGGDISVIGGLSTARSMFLAGLVDRLTLTIHPAVTNEGRRLFDESVPTTRLKLEEGDAVGAVRAARARLRRCPDHREGAPCSTVVQVRNGGFARVTPYPWVCGKSIDV